MSKNTLDVAEVAALLGVSHTTIYKLVREQQIPHFRVRSRIFFRLDSINEWISEMENKAVNSK